MINTLQISGVHSQLTKKERNYVLKKIGGLDKYIPRMARPSTHVEVKLKDRKAKDKRTHECEVIMKLPKTTITSHRNSTSIIAAIDEVEENLKKQLKRYKDLHTFSKISRRAVARIGRKNQPNLSS
jgi:ribosomal subunit interface protein